MDRARLVFSGSSGMTVLACLALLSIVSAATVLSGAYFTGAAPRRSVAVSAGYLSVTNPDEGSAIVTATYLRPGESRCGTVTLSNASHLDRPVAVSVISLRTSDTPEAAALSNALTLAIDDVTEDSTTIWRGSMSSLTTQTLGTLATGETRRFRFALSFPECNATPALQGSDTSMSLMILEESQ